MKPREKIIKAVLEAPGLSSKIKELSQAGAGDEQTLRKQAGRHLSEIAADYNECWVGVWEKLLKCLWHTMYDGFEVDQEGMEKIRAISRKVPFVIIPCHRSHLDYLIIAYVFRKQGIPLPRVAAGLNMNFWPLGYLFRQSGAFFLRRTFQGNDLYAFVFAAYVGELLKEGIPIEFFLEGGRSRTGKMLLPRYGMISMIIRAHQDKMDDDLALIPVSIGYDRIVEENSYLKELSGVPKRHESLLDVIKHAKIMMHSYGRAYLNIGKPLFLKSHFAVLPKPFADMSWDDKQALYRNIGAKVASEINRVSVVTPVSLTAAALLSRTEKEISVKYLTATFTALYDYLRYKKVNFASALSSGNKAMTAVLELFNKRGYLSMKCDSVPGDAASYLILEEKRLNLEYYKNNIVHHFLPLSLVSLSILSCPKGEMTVSRIADDGLFLKNLLRREFIFEGDGEEQLKEAISYLKQSNVIKEEEGQIICRTKEEREQLTSFAGLLRSYLEAYWVVLNAFSQDEKAFACVGDPLNYLRLLAEDMYGKGDILRIESLSQENYKNALNLLQEDGMLDLKKSQGTKGIVSIPDKNRLEAVRIRLSGFIYPAGANFIS